METKDRSNTALPPLAWAAGIALIVFSAVGVGAIMGWIPTSMGNSAMGNSDSKPALSGAVSPAAAPVTPAAKPAAKVAQAPVAPLPVAPGAPSRTSARCAECGIIESVREVDVKGEGSGIGVVGGAVVGGLLGNQVGGGRGKDVMTVVGAVGGGFAGNEVEKRVKASKSYSITVRLEDGSARVINQSAAPAWRAGDKVKVVNGVIQSNA
jgi:outer membrane lipoprotein SlyB